MTATRAAGILLHVSSLPSAHGVGDFGPAAYRFVDFLERAGQTVWQILPLGPTGFGNSPYQSPSSFAGNALFVSLEALSEQGWLEPQELKKVPEFPKDEADFEAVYPWHRQCLMKAFERFNAQGGGGHAELAKFHEQNAWWLDDYSLFIALKESSNDAQWTEWSQSLIRREAKALAEARSKLAPRIDLENFIQYQFFRQWMALKHYANARGIRIVGDVPIFVAHDSADVWAHQDRFYLDKSGLPTVVAGVPPDYFSETGQLWGNPLYRWDLLESRGFDWWIQRLGYAFQLFDQVRLDHFRGFAAYWEVPGGAENAIGGRWMTGPGHALFVAAKEKLGALPLIAEDLGVITPDVEALRDDLRLPGMRVLQFAFGDDAKASDYQPHNYPHECVVYTGTHDNDTTVGWFRSQAGEGTTRTAEEIRRERDTALAYMNTDGTEIAWDMIRLAWASVANTAIVPLQDVLQLGNETRMNLPGTASGNWRWRVDEAELTSAIEGRLRALTETYERLPRVRQVPAKGLADAFD